MWVDKLQMPGVVSEDRVRDLGALPRAGFMTSSRPVYPEPQFPFL